MKVVLINCESLAQVAHSLVASWSGDNVLTVYNGTQYPLYKETTGEAVAHEALIRIIAPTISDTDTVEQKLAKGDAAVNSLPIEWDKWSTYPNIEVN